MGILYAIFVERSLEKFLICIGIFVFILEISFISAIFVEKFFVRKLIYRFIIRYILGKIYLGVFCVILVLVRKVYMIII